MDRQAETMDDDGTLGVMVEGHLVGMSTAGLRHRRVHRAGCRVVVDVRPLRSHE